MGSQFASSIFVRRSILKAASVAGLGFATSIGAGQAAPLVGGEPDDAERLLLVQLTGGAPIVSPRVRLDMPAVFGNGYSVPLAVGVDSPMDDRDHVRSITIIAPKNPIVLVAAFQFTPDSGRAEIATRIRLSEPQNVVAVAAMGDGALLMARTWVKVAVNGCA